MFGFFSCLCEQYAVLELPGNVDEIKEPNDEEFTN
jgi:hypothetical protein